MNVNTAIGMRMASRCSRLCSRVLYRRSSTQIQRCLRTAALPTSSKSRETASPSSSRSRSFSATHCARVPAQDLKSEDDKAWKLQEGLDGPDLNLLYVKTQGQAWHPTFLRDLCTCPLCVDPSSKQKNFQTTDIPATIEAKTLIEQPNGDLTITWTTDVTGFSKDHVSTIPAALLQTLATRKSIAKARYMPNPKAWGNKYISERLQYVDFEEYMNDDQRLWHALKLLEIYGILLIRGVPDDEHAVEKLTSRIGRIRDTFYGRTWDVKSVFNARNVAYTPQHLGLHMDLLYMENPPGFQFLHCLKNTSPGGTSLFSDALWAAHTLPQSVFHTLATQEIAFEYRNDGQHYYFERPVLELGLHTKYVHNFTTGQDMSRPEILNINWSPPFQAPLPYSLKLQGRPLPKVLQALRIFGSRVQDPRNLYKYRLNKGECVVFNNRRVLHGRTAFDASQGERWLKGTYVDTDVFRSRLRVLSEQYKGRPELQESKGLAKYVHPEAVEEALRRTKAHVLAEELVAEKSITET